MTTSKLIYDFLDMVIDLLFVIFPDVKIRILRINLFNRCSGYRARKRHR